MRGTEREGEKNSNGGKDSKKFLHLFYVSQTHMHAGLSCVQQMDKLQLHCLINVQSARGASAVLILNYSALQQCDSPHSRNPVSRLANVRTDGDTSFRVFSFLRMPRTIAGCCAEFAYARATPATSRNYAARQVESKLTLMNNSPFRATSPRLYCCKN